MDLERVPSRTQQLEPFEGTNIRASPLRLSFHDTLTVKPVGPNSILEK